MAIQPSGKEEEIARDYFGDATIIYFGRFGGGHTSSIGKRIRVGGRTRQKGVLEDAAAAQKP